MDWIGESIRRLDAEDELAVHETLPVFVQQERVDPVAEGEVHGRGDEDVVPAVGVQVVDAHSPGPVIFDADLVGDLLEPTAALPTDRSPTA